MREVRTDFKPEPTPKLGLRSCKHCGKSFKPSYGPQRFCGTHCWYAFRRAAVAEIACEHCGVKFRPKPHEARRNRRFCSNACQGFATRSSGRRLCPVCGTIFYLERGPAGHLLHRKTCSTACRNEAVGKSKQGRGNPNYATGITLAKTRWRGAVESVCRWCSLAETRLVVHHVVYEQHVRKHGGDTLDPANGLTLCNHCHGLHHSASDDRVPVAALRPENLSFATALLGDYVADYFARYYHWERYEIESALDKLYERSTG